jgi:hypothetical protein
MSRIALEGNVSGTGVFTLASPNGNTNRTLTLPDEAGTVLTSVSNIAAANLTGSLPAISGAALTDLPASGKVLQVVSAKCGNGTSTARIPVDNTTPTNTEGVQIWTASITPASASNTILVSGACQASGNANSLYYQFALFRGATCIGAWQAENSWSNAGVMLTLCFMDSPATTSSTTYSIRASTNASTFYYGSVFSNNFGNLGENYYILQEIAP